MRDNYACLAGKAGLTGKLAGEDAGHGDGAWS